MRAWIAVACAAHVRIGRGAGFMQVCHGKGGPLRRIAPGDLVTYYSPTTEMGGKDRLQSFTAFGQVMDRAPYQVEMAPGFLPFRRDVAWCAAHPASIAPLLPMLEVTRGRSNWGYAFRFGLVQISLADARIIAEAMAVADPLLG